MEDTYTVGVIVRAKIPRSEANSTGMAVGMLCEQIRNGIGEEPRKWEMAIAAGGVKGRKFGINESLLIDLNEEMKKIF